MITYNYDIDVIPGGVPLVVPLTQYSDAFTLVFALYSSSGTLSLVSGATGEVIGTKTDGNGYSAAAVVDTASGTVTVTGDQQMTAVAGNQTFRLLVKQGGRELYTANFVLAVQRAAMDVDTITSDTKLRELYEMDVDQIVQAGQTALSNATQAASAAATAEEQAEIATGAADRAETAITHAPMIQNGTWYVWDADAGRYQDSGVAATGPQGPTPVRGTDYWTEADKTEIVNDVLLEVVPITGQSYNLILTLPASAWDDTAGTQTILASGVLADETRQLIEVVPAAASKAAYGAAGVCCIDQTEEGLIFSCITIPSVDLTVYAVVTPMTAAEESP